MKQKNISKLEDHLGYWLRCISNYVHNGFADRLKQYDVSVAQWVVLRCLYEKKATSLNEAAKIVGVDNSTLSRMMERLVQKGLVMRVADSKDRRAITLSLSSMGIKLVPALAREADQNDKEFFGSLSMKEQKNLLDTVQKLLSDNGWKKSTHGRYTME